MTTTNRMIVMPAPGKLVRHQDTRKLADGGESVVVNSYWIRRLTAGDVVEVKTPQPADTENKGK